MTKSPSPQQGTQPGQPSQQQGQASAPGQQGGQPSAPQPGLQIRDWASI